jgi:uncharacterized protein YvpB
MRITLPRVLVAVLLVLILAIGIYLIPPVRERVDTRVELVRMQIYSYFNPPDQAVFQPEQQSQLATIVAATMQAYQYQTPVAPTATVTPPPGAPTFPPTITPTPLPTTVALTGIKYEDQSGLYNYCGPTNFSMALTYWGWTGNRYTIGKVLMPGNNLDKNGKPGNNDKNVMPYELQDYITKYVPGMTSIIRYGGDIDLLRSMIAAGYPVVVEKGIDEVDINGKFSWMGHYAFVTGYDDAKQEIIYQDTYQPSGAPPGHNRRISYDKFNEGWRAFNDVFIVVYPFDREAQVNNLLGDYVDNNWALQHALDVAQGETKTLTGRDQYFAWFNVGTSYVEMNDYTDAAQAYDTAFPLYNGLGKNVILPYRMLWYQTGLYKAYFYTNRWNDVINFASTTLKTTSDGRPTLEESLYWRAKAEYALGDVTSAIADYRAALILHPDWVPAVQALQDLGVQP